MTKKWLRAKKKGELQEFRSRRIGRLCVLALDPIEPGVMIAVMEMGDADGQVAT